MGQISFEILDGFDVNLIEAHAHLQQAARIMHALCREDTSLDTEEMRTSLLWLLNQQIPDTVRQCVYYSTLAYNERKRSSLPDLPEKAQEGDHFESFDFFPDWTPVHFFNPQ